MHQHNYGTQQSDWLYLVAVAATHLQVRCCHGNRGDWWYDHGAVRPIHMKYVPESLRAAVRPGWGDYVALSHDHGSFGTAADGPMEPGNLGVVVAVHDVPDSKGGLTSARYTVRACHNGQAYRCAGLWMCLGSVLLDAVQCCGWSFAQLWQHVPLVSIRIFVGCALCSGPSVSNSWL